METLKIYRAVNPSESSDELIRTAASHITGLNREHFRIIREKGKKPYFENSELHFSVSHSLDLWICIFAENEVGCDVQFRREGVRFKRLAERWFAREEAEECLTERDFYDIWSRKEAYVKYLGTGIDEKFRTYNTFSPHLAVIHDVKIEDDGYSCAAAYGNEFDIEIIDIKNL